MQAYAFPRSFGRDILACLLATGLIALFAHLFSGIEFGSAEEGPLETVQEWFLALSLALLAGSAVVEKAGPARLAAATGAVASAVFFLRELEPTGTGPVAAYLLSDAFRWHEAIVIALLALAAAPSQARFVPDIVRWMFGCGSWPLLLAGLALVFGEAIDGHHAWLGVEYLPRFIEEAAETFAYAVILACSVRWFATARELRSQRATLG